ncbi:unnamed protein product, partial [marine sediment metagenome]
MGDALLFASKSGYKTDYEVINLEDTFNDPYKTLNLISTTEDLYSYNFQFYDDLTTNTIDGGVTFILKDEHGVTINSNITTGTGMLNIIGSIPYPAELLISARHNNYISIDDYAQTFGSYARRIYLKPKYNLSITDLFSISGYVLDENDELLTYTRLRLICKGGYNPKIESDSNGAYEFINIPRSTECSIDIDDTSYISSIYTFKLGANRTRNLTYTLRSGSGIDDRVNFNVYVIDEINRINVEQKIMGAKLYVEGVLKCTTNAFGNCPNSISLLSGELYDIQITKEGFEPHPQEILSSDYAILPLKVSMVPIGLQECQIKGETVYLQGEIERSIS